MPIASYAPTKQTLGQILGSTSPPIRVPDYQRDFSWQSKHISDFWNDLVGFDQQFPGQELQGREYFLGSSVLVQTATHHLLLDGQQRLATGTILLSAIRDKLRPVNQNAANQIQTEFIVFEDHLAGGARKYKLKLNVFDRDFFRDRIQDQPGTPPPPTKRSHRLIMAARKYFDDKLSDVWSQTTQEAAIARTSRLANILTAHFGFVVVSSTDQDHAASIFETLNDRGIGLSTADLLRSWLLTEAQPETRDEMIRLWTEIFRSARKEKPEVVIRASWVSRHGDVKSRSMYKEIKAKLQADATMPSEFTRQLHSDALVYHKLVKSATGDAVVDEVCRGLVRLKAAGCFAPLIAASNQYQQPADVAKVATALATLTVRHNLVCGRDPTKLEAKAFEVAQLISNGSPLVAVLSSLRQLSPTDADFNANFTNLTFSPNKHRLVQIILRTIENNRTNTGEKIIAPPQRVHVEHVYAQNPQPGNRWPDHDTQVYRLGNLTLLGAALNTEQQNAPFAQKIAAYQQSQFLITQELAGKVDWNANEIAQRQKSLCAEASRIWPAQLV